MPYLATPGDAGWPLTILRSKRDLVFLKKATRKPSIFYDDIVEQAICVGWIDSQIKSIDWERLVPGFTPRLQDSAWSDRNGVRA